MNNRQIVTVSFFRYQGWKYKWQAFRDMGRAPGIFFKTPGLTFIKMLGSGGGNGFSIRPNFGVYGLLAVWEREAAAIDFFNTNLDFHAFKNACTEHWTVFLQTTLVHGKWEGENPFQIIRPSSPNGPIAVLTRATIYPSKLWRFWQYVPQVGKSVDDKPGLLFSIGVGELPLIQQATFSVWQSAQQMKDFAYKSNFHREVIRKTRENGWYREELFARFEPYRSVGTWQDQDPLRELI